MMLTIKRKVLVGLFLITLAVPFIGGFNVGHVPMSGGCDSGVICPD